MRSTRPYDGNDIEVFDAEQNALRIEINGGGSVARFNFGQGDKAESVSMAGDTFTRDGD